MTAIDRFSVSPPIGVAFHSSLRPAAGQVGGPRGNVSRRVAGTGLILAFFAVAVTGCGGGDEAQPDTAQGTGSTPSPAPSPTPSPSPTGSASLAWSPPADSRVRGYRVYFGTTSRSYLQGKGAGADAGASASYTVSGLQRGRTYYFAVTAYDATGNESDYSAEAAKSIA